ncbi:hypothetical protein HUW50_23130 [Metabacillus sp. KUDC1714]|uniref:Transposase n=1 Tax=Metabacillus elymi TaxID=2745198 RepID=A0ABX6SB44_9BACI|nr:hypothetical protein [Metabacillus sp. KUDC1714]QNF30106.1 hypothetical protein HUW50_23130 [Metabacillus sp. KUDC1714]
MDQFENGFVQQSLNALIECLDILHTQLIFDTETTYIHEEFLPFLDIDESSEG